MAYYSNAGVNIHQAVGEDDFPTSAETPNVRVDSWYDGVLGDPPMQEKGLYGAYGDGVLGAPGGVLAPVSTAAVLSATNAAADSPQPLSPDAGFDEEMARRRIEAFKDGILGEEGCAGCDGLSEYFSGLGATPAGARRAKAKPKKVGIALAPKKPAAVKRPVKKTVKSVVRKFPFPILGAMAVGPVDPGVIDLRENHAVTEMKQLLAAVPQVAGTVLSQAGQTIWNKDFYASKYWDERASRLTKMVALALTRSESTGRVNAGGMTYPNTDVVAKALDVVGRTYGYETLGSAFPTLMSSLGAVSKVVNGKVTVDWAQVTILAPHTDAVEENAGKPVMTAGVVAAGVGVVAVGGLAYWWYTRRRR